MKAVILASGLGSRLADITKLIPKSLIEVHGQTLLERAVTSLIANGCTDIIITTGYLDRKIQEHLRISRFSQTANIRYVYNPQFAQSNYIYSLWLAREFLLGDDILLLHGDLIFDTSLLYRLINQTRSVVLVNKSVTDSEKDFKARIENDKVMEIGVSVRGSNCYLCMPFYRLLKRDMALWMEQIEKYINDDNVKIYAENAFNDISDCINLYPLYFDKEVCMEIDTIEDLALARSLVQ
jgi:phosphoenolpyruvate phosphomutase